MSRRTHPRRRPAVHRPPVEETPAPPLDKGRIAAEEARTGVWQRSVFREDPVETPLQQAARLEALTEVWGQQLRAEGPVDATMLYAAAGSSRPPVPPARTAPPAPVEPIPAADDEPAAAEVVPPPPVVASAAALPRVIRNWTSRHDPRSRDFDLRSRLSASLPLQDRLLELGPVLDQGTTPPLTLHDASGCVGMAVAAAGNALHLATASEYLAAHRVADADGLLTRDDALALYGRAQQLDHLSGESYPGTSVLAGMKAAVEAGLWPSYLWAFGTKDIAQALLRGLPVVIGIPWDAHLDQPDEAGIVTPGKNTGSAGGHALALTGFRMTHAGRSGPWFRAQQSRGPAHGDAGCVWFHHRHMAGLLAGVGEAAIPVPPGGVS
jgi:hypothetical protein